MTSRRYFLSLLCVLLLCASVASGQMRRQGGPPPYDPAKEVTVRGTVITTDTIAPGDGPEQTVLVLQVGDAEMGVFVGPAAWVAKQAFTLAPRTEVEVTGMPGFKYLGRAALTPRLMKAGSRTLTLRDETGRAKWEAPRDQR